MRVTGVLFTSCDFAWNEGAVVDVELYGGISGVTKYYYLAVQQLLLSTQPSYTAWSSMFCYR